MDVVNSASVRPYFCRRRLLGTMARMFFKARQEGDQTQRRFAASRIVRSALWFAPLWLVVIVCCALPLGWMGVQIAMHPRAVAELRLDGFRWMLLRRTLLFNGSAGVLATVLGLPAAIVIGRGDRRLAALVWFVLPMSLLVPSLTYAYGWAEFFQFPHVRQVLGWMHIQMTLAGPADVFRCIWSLATWLWAIPAALIGLALLRVDGNVQQQALLDGALWRITARQLAGPALASVAIATILASQEFAVYEPTGISVVATEVRMVFDTGGLSSALNPMTAPIIPAKNAGPAGPDQAARAAAALVTSLPLLVIIALLGAAAAWAVRNLASAEEIESGPLPKALQAGAVPVVLAALSFFLAVVVPIGSMIRSLRSDFSFERFWQVYEPQMTGSIVLAGTAAAGALLMAICGAVRRTRVLLPIMLLSFLAGGQMLAIALIRLFNRPWPGDLRGPARMLGVGPEAVDPFAWIYNGIPIVAMAYLARFGWLALCAAAVTWSRPWRFLRDVAALDGAGPARTAASIIWPLAWPVLLASAVLVMALSLTEVPATVLLYPMRPQAFTPMLMSWVHALNFDPMIEGSLLLMGCVLLLGAAAATLVWVGLRLTRGSLWRAAPALLGALLLAGLSGCGDGGKPQAVWCETGTGPGEVVYPRAITYSRADDTFFIIDRVAHVQHLDHDGRCLCEWQMPQWKQGKPVGASVGPDGDLWVPDTHYHRVVVYSPDGKLLRMLGHEGTGDGQFLLPTDIAFEGGHIFVSEYGGNDRVQVFDRDWHKLYQFGRFGNRDGEFSRPQSMVIDRGLVYITDACNHRLAVFTTGGKWVRNIGSAGSALGQFRFPYGLDEDREGHLIVCEFGNNRVQKIDKETGRGLNIWGSPGRMPGQLAYPWGVAVDNRNRIVAVDAGNNRLQVFSF